MGNNGMAVQQPYNMVPGPSANGTHGMPPGSNQSTTTTQHRQDQFRNQILKQQRLLLFLRHCAKCKNPKCTHAQSCETGKELWHHLVRCKDDLCKYPRCVHARELLRHYQKCQKPQCSICGPVRKYVEGAQAMSQRQTSSQSNGPQNGMAVAHAPIGGSTQHNGMQMPGMMQVPQGMHQGPLLNGLAMAPGGMHPGAGMQGMPGQMVPARGHGMHQNALAPHPSQHRRVKRESDMSAYYNGGYVPANGVLHGGEPDMKRYKPAPHQHMLQHVPPAKVKTMDEVKVRPALRLLHTRSLC
jgi:E1A/CREB-binding protein